MRSAQPSSARELAVILGLLLLLLFVSPLADWWSDAELPWYTVYGLWALVILLSALLGWKQSKDDA